MLQVVLGTGPMLDFSHSHKLAPPVDLTRDHDALQTRMKDVFDRALALVALILLAPLFAVVALAIKLEAPGPVFFRQPRGGKDGQLFLIYKFRSMGVDASSSQATRNDPRVTRVGAFIRKTSIDELPQLINILLGEMSFVGPRPHAAVHDEYYALRVPHYMNRYAVKPGLTGWAQINRARGETETVDKMARRIRLDVEYIRNWSIWLDLKILLRTPLTLVTSDEAY